MQVGGAQNRLTVLLLTLLSFCCWEVTRQATLGCSVGREELRVVLLAGHFMAQVLRREGYLGQVGDRVHLHHGAFV